MTSRFDQKIALITGGTSGMGFATAQRLLAEGADVIITGRELSRLEAAVKELDGGDRVLALQSDAANLADLDSLTAAIEERYGRLDVVFANAGVASFKPYADFSETEFDRVVDINFKGVFFTIQKVLPLLSDNASIVINASWTLHRGMPNGSLYSATKAAVHNLSHTLAAELGPAESASTPLAPAISRPRCSTTPFPLTSTTPSSPRLSPPGSVQLRTSRTPSPSSPPPKRHTSTAKTSSSTAA